MKFQYSLRGDFGPFITSYEPEAPEAPKIIEVRDRAREVFGVDFRDLLKTPVVLTDDSGDGRQEDAGLLSVSDATDPSDSEGVKIHDVGSVQDLIDRAQSSLAHQLLVVEALGAYPKDDQAFEYLIGLIRLDFATCGSGLVSDLVPLELNHVRNDEKFYVDLPHTKSGNPIYAGFDKGQSDTTPFERMQDGLFQGEIDALKRMPLDIVLAAIKSLAKHNTERAMRVLVHLVENHPHAEVQSVCKETLSSVQPLLLASMILEGDAVGSELLFEMLMSCPNQAHVINMLFILADSDKTNVRCAAIKYLGGMAGYDKKISTFIRRLTVDKNSQVAVAARAVSEDDARLAAE